MLLYLLSRLVRQGLTRQHLVSTDRFPGVDPFHGLGQLTPADLSALFARRRPVTGPQLAQAVTGWQAYCSRDPQAIASWLATEPPPSRLCMLPSAII